MNGQPAKNILFWVIGLLFSALWASASVASKIGLQSGQPFVVSFCRFTMASAIMLVVVHLLMRKPLPSGKQWRQLLLFGLLNVALYLGLFILAIRYVSAGLGSLAVGVGPVLIAVMYAIVQRQPLPAGRIFSLILGMGGVVVCAWPLLQTSHATVGGLITLFASMSVYSIGTIYFRKTDWQGLHILTINGWQTFFGALFTLPFMLWQWNGALNFFDLRFWSATSWLAVMVSIGAVQGWIYMLSHFGEKSAYWLFLCPIFGFVYSAILTGESIGMLTISGTVMVLAALWMNVKIKG
jgi:drug/metabolite transporter (DMT)-like permease